MKEQKYPTSADGERSQRRSTPRGRWLAFRALQAFHQRGVFVSTVLDELFRESRAEPRERGFATELASETVRRKFTIETILSHYVSRPRESVEDDLWVLLELGCCQLLFLEQVPPHAAVDETVKLCDRLRKPRARGFINGILRSLQRDLVVAQDHRPFGGSGPLLSECTERTIPVLDPRNFRNSYRVVELARPVFSSPVYAPLDYIAEAASLPLWLVRRWASQLRQIPGEFPASVDWTTSGREAVDALFATALWLSTSGRMSLRVNLLQTTRERLLEVLRTAGVESQPGEFPEAINLAGSVAVGDLPGFREGWFSVQDESAMSAVDLLDPRPGESVLDLCSAPGGKTTHIAERLQGTGTVLACDTSATRLETVHENGQRLRFQTVRTQLISPSGDDLPAGPYHAVLVDVPCSNTGVLGKRPEARWRIAPESFVELVPLQRRLLHDAMIRTVSGGRVVYSTCSIDNVENESVVRSVLSSHPEFRIVEERHHHPGQPADGGYQALLVRG